MLMVALAISGSGFRSSTSAVSIGAARLRSMMLTLRQTILLLPRVLASMLDVSGVVIGSDGEFQRATRQSSPDLLGGPGQLENTCGVSLETRHGNVPYFFEVGLPRESCRR